MTVFGFMRHCMTKSHPSGLYGKRLNVMMVIGVIESAIARGLLVGGFH